MVKSVGQSGSLETFLDVGNNSTGVLYPCQHVIDPRGAFGLLASRQAMDTRNMDAVTGVINTGEVTADE